MFVVPPPANVPVADARRCSRYRYALVLAAVLVAGAAQAVIETRPWLSLAGFAVGVACFVFADRWDGMGHGREDWPRRPAPWWFWVAVGIGCAASVAAGVLVFAHASPRVTHPPWFAGLAVLASGASWLWWRERAPLSRRNVITAALLLVLAGGFFGWRLSDFPPEVHGDEGEEGMDAIVLLERPFDLFTAGWYWLPRFHVLRMAVGMRVFGVNLVGLRSTSVALGAATVLLVFGIGLRLWGYKVGLLAALVLVCARGFIHLSRTGYSYLDAPFYSALVAWLMVVAWRDGRRGAAVWCGIALGLCVQTYYAARLVPILLAVTWVVWLMRSEPSLRSARMRDLALIVVVALATAAPLFGFFAHYWDGLWARTRDTSVFAPGMVEHLGPAYGARDVRYIIFVQAIRAATFFNLTPDTSLQYGFPGGLFDPVTAVFFVLGVGLVCWRPSEPRNQLVLLWVGLTMIIGGVLTIETPCLARVSGMLPLAVLPVGLALSKVVEATRRVWPADTGRKAAVVAGACLIGAIAVGNIRTYFLQYAPQHFHSPAVGIATWIRENGAGKKTFAVGPGLPLGHGSVRFLAHGYATEDVPDLAERLQTQAFDRGKSLFIVQPQGRKLLDQLDAAVGPLEVHEHRNPYTGALEFYSAVPRAIS